MEKSKLFCYNVLVVSYYIFLFISFFSTKIRGGLSVQQRIIAFFLIFTLSVLSLFACNNDNQEISLNYPISTEPASLDPQIANSISERLFVKNAFEGLVTLGENGEIIPGVASSWTISEDGLTYIFNLRNDAKWYLSNTATNALEGLIPEAFDERVTAHDFVFALRRAIDPITVSPDAYLLENIENAKEILNGEMNVTELGITASSDYKLMIKLQKPDSAFLHSLTAPAFMPCNEVFFDACKGRYGLSLKYILCNGPFILFRWNPSSSLKLTKNTKYSGERLVVPDTVWLNINSDNASVLSRVLSGSYAGAFISAEQYSSLPEKHELLLTERQNVLWAFIFNFNSLELKNINLRQSFVHATDLSNIKPQNHMSVRTNSAIPPYCKPNIFDIKSPKILGYDETKAQETLNKALNDLDQNSLELTLICSEEHENMIRKLMQNWQRIFGVNLTIRLNPLDNETLKTRVDSGNYEIAFYPIEAETNKVEDYLRIYTTDHKDNFTGYNNEQYDISVNSISASSETIKEQYEKCEQMLIDNAVLLPVFSQNSYFALNQNFTGISFFASQDNVFFISANRVK